MTEREETRNRILMSSLKLFAERGFHNTRVSDIVKEAGVAQGTFYLYFSNKQEVFYSLTEMWLKEMADALEQSARTLCQPRSPEEAAQRIYQLVKETLLIYCKNKAMVKIMEMHGTSSHEIRDICAKFERRMVRILKEELLRYPLYRDFDDEELEMAALAHMGMIEKVAHYWFVVRGEGPEGAEKAARLLTQIIYS